MTPGRKANGRTVIKLFDPRVRGPLSRQGRFDDATLQSEKGSREERG